MTNSSMLEKAVWPVKTTPSPEAGQADDNDQSTPRKGDYHHGNLPAALIEQALAQIDKAGPERVGLRGVARAAGVSESAPYAHFKDRDALMTAVAAQWFCDFRCRMARAVEDVPQALRLSALAHAYLRFGLEHPGLYLLLFSTPYLREAGPKTTLHAAARAAFDLLLTVFDTAQDEMDRRRLGMRLWTSLHGMVCVELALTLPGTPRISAAELVDDLVAELERQAAKV